MFLFTYTDITHSIGCTSQSKMYFFVLTVFLINFAFSRAQMTIAPLIPEVDAATRDLINSVYGANPNDFDCTCVPSYLCSDSNNIITDGGGIFDIKGRASFCNPDWYVCCRAPLPMPTNTPVSKVPYKTKGCGFHNAKGVGTRILGEANNESEFGEFPWMVAILYRKENETKHTFRCGGALINPQVVLTGAHCLGGNPDDFIIRAGEWDMQSTDENLPHQDHKVHRFLLHQEYNSVNLFNDVALIFLQGSFNITWNVDIICLPPSSTVPDQKDCLASGWGADNIFKGSKDSEILKKVELPIVERFRCQEYLRKTRLSRYFRLDRSFICAGGEEGKDTCGTDGGSPLVCPIPGMAGRYYQAGIVAWGIGCGEKDVPGAYVNVPHFKHWIDVNMRARGYSTKEYTY